VERATLYSLLRAALSLTMPSPRHLASARCSSHASATVICKQGRPKQGEGKDQASETFKCLPCTWK